jgi:hypothetical protein
MLKIQMYEYINFSMHVVLNFELNIRFVYCLRDLVISSRLLIQRSGFHSWRYQIFWEVAGLERRPLSLVSTIEELLGRKSSVSSLENREYGRRDPSCWHGTLYVQKLPLSSPTSGCLSVSIVRSQTQATEFSIVFIRIVSLLLTYTY